MEARVTHAASSCKQAAQQRAVHHPSGPSFVDGLGVLCALGLPAAAVCSRHLCLAVVHCWGDLAKHLCHTHLLKPFFCLRGHFGFPGFFCHNFCVNLCAPRFTNVHFAATSERLRILTVCPRPDLMRCSVRLSVISHSATSSASGDEISTTLSWNSGVNSSQF